METIVDNGVTFVKATALAKKYRYTTDYIGQLCRSGKVDAKLIGRAWFVSESSLKNHQNDRYGSTRSSEIIINKSLVSDRESHPVTLKREVQSPLSKTAHRSVMQVADPKTYNFELRGATRVSTYHADDSSLAPQSDSRMVVSPRSPVSPQVDQAPHKINVSLGEKAARTLRFEPLPEINLRGELTIDSLDDPDLFAPVEPVLSADIDFAAKTTLNHPVVVTKRYAPKTRTQSPVFLSPVVEMTFEDQLVPEVSSIPASKKDMAQNVQVVLPQSAVRFIVVPVFVAFAVGVCGLVLGLVSYAETDGLEFRQSLKFSVAAAVESMTTFTESY